MKRFGGTQAYRWAFNECQRQFYHWYVGAPTSAPGAFQLLLFQRGRELEERYLGMIRERVPSYVEIRETARRLRAAATVAAMADGVEFIAHPVLEPKDRFGLESQGIEFGGEADALRRVGDKRLPSGLYPYEVIEVKSAGHVLEHHRAQLAFYSMLLASVQKHPPGGGIVITWRRGDQGLEPVENAVDTGPVQAQLEEFIQYDLAEHATDPKADYHLRSACDSCPYLKICEELAPREEHLSLLHGLRRRQRANLIQANVRTWPELAVPPGEFEKVEARWGGTTHILRRLRTQALALKYDACFYKGRLVEHLGLVAESGRRPTVAAGSSSFTGARIYFDLETDPLESTVYLFGYQVEEVRRTKGRLVDFRNALEAHCSAWGALQPPNQKMGTGQTEGELFEAFLDEMDELRVAYGRIYIFHYSGFETSQLKSLARKYPSIESVAERVARIVDECVDLHDALVKTRCLPISSYSLKEVAPCLHRLTDGRHGHKWDGPRDRDDLGEFLLSRGMDRADARRNIAVVERAASRWGLTLDKILAPSAGTSVLWYREHVDESAPVWLALIEAYNADDLLAARAVAHWLIEESWAEEEVQTSPQVSGLQVPR